jgi:hypothetical protein
MGTEGDPLFTALLSESACPKVNMPLYVCCKTRPLPCTTRPVHYPSAAPSAAAGHHCCCLPLQTATAVHSGWDMCSCGQPGLYHQCSGRGVHGTAAPHVSLVLYIMSRWGAPERAHGVQVAGVREPRPPADVGGWVGVVYMVCGAPTQLAADQRLRMQSLVTPTLGPC